MSISIRPRQDLFLVIREDRAIIDPKTKRPKKTVVLRVPFSDPELPAAALATLDESDAEEVVARWNLAKEHRRKDLVIRRISRFRTKARHLIPDLATLGPGDIPGPVLQHLAKELKLVSEAALEAEKRLSSPHDSRPGNPVTPARF